MAGIEEEVKATSDATPAGDESTQPPADSTKATTDSPPPKNKPAAAPVATEEIEYDDFGLPLKRVNKIQYAEQEEKDATSSGARSGADASNEAGGEGKANGGVAPREATSSTEKEDNAKNRSGSDDEDGNEDEFEDAVSEPAVKPDAAKSETPKASTSKAGEVVEGETAKNEKSIGIEDEGKKEPSATDETVASPATQAKTAEPTPAVAEEIAKEAAKEKETQSNKKEAPRRDLAEAEHRRDVSLAGVFESNGVSEYSHQQVTLSKKDNGDDDGEWQTMPAFASYDMYDDNNKLIAKEHHEDEDESYSYAGMGGAGKGYTRVLVDDDAESATSMDENTGYLFKNAGGTSMMDDEDTRDAVSQMQATKDLLTEGQKIAYVGLTRIELFQMVKEMEKIEYTRPTKKAVQTAAEAMKMWGQKIMIRLYTHMEISSAEQVMIEQLAEHGVMSSDLTPQLMANARVKNPMADRESSISSSRPSVSSPRLSSAPNSPKTWGDEAAAEPPPAYDKHEGEELPRVRTPSQLPTSDKLDIDIRWTILCDLFLVLIADSIYDSRSRVLFERVGKALEIDWVDICRFERKVTEALEMQQAAERENWNEDEHMENRRKLALKKRYVVMGLATVGGGLVIGLSAGLLAPVIGAGLAAGFTTIGVTGTSSFLAGAGGAAIITASSATSGGIIGARAANRRTGAVKTFEYRPLHNNKRVNLIVSVSGWMTGKVDDVRLPFSTVDPVMGDIYSILWEPEMLTSMGDTINILATEALTQGLQQVLGSTILVSLMAALQLPVVLTKLSYLIDNPWSVSLDRAWAAGLILADSLIERNLGTRPITLVGYSLGSRVIFSCLLELARKGAFGLIQNVYMFGSPIVVKQDEYLKIRTVVSGRIVNGYHRNDWILGYLFRLTNGGIRRVAGLAPVEGIPGLENSDTSELVAGHMDYRRAMPRLLRENGWLVESDEFTEIEDPDPENHTQRQRELINEIEEARKELEKEGANANNRKSGFGGFFSRKKKAQKAEWEVYEDSKSAGANGASKSEGSENGSNNNSGVLFDVDAIRAELSKTQEEETLQVRELKSTLPPMKLPSPGLPTSPTSSLGQSRSMDTSAYSYHASPNPSVDYGHGNHGIQMTFDSGFDDSHRAQRSQTVSTTDSSMTRPEIKTAQTVPNMASSNPWADLDDDDDDFGKEKEISMTFA